MSGKKWLKHLVVATFCASFLYMLFCHVYRFRRDASLYDNYGTYGWAIEDTHAESIDIQRMVSHAIYVYEYYPPGTKIPVSSSILATISEDGRMMALHILIQRMKAKTGEDLGDDLDPYVLKYGTEYEISCYTGIKEGRAEMLKGASPNISRMERALRMNSVSSHETETEKSEN